MYYRTRTYIAGDWTGDKDAIDQLYEWNDRESLCLSFTDAHDLTQARDSSLNCSIKKSLLERLNASNTFVLIVGKETLNLRAGGCQYCQSYNSWNVYCARGGYYIDYRSYVEYECEKALEAYNKGLMRIIVLYNFTSVDRNKCPACLRRIGVHVAMCYKDAFNYKIYWDYRAVLKALRGY